MQAHTKATSRAAISRNPNWEEALDEVLRRTSLTAEETTHGESPDLVLLFASYHHRRDYGRLVGTARDRTGARLLAGCSGQGIIGPASEVEAEPALSVLQLRSAGSVLTGVHVTQERLTDSASGGALSEALDLPPSEVNAWLLLADPFHLDVERLLTLLEEGYPTRPLIGGLASAGPGQQSTCLFLNDAVLEEGAIAIAVGGELTIRTLVSQGATPIGRPWTITAAHDNFLDTIGGRPAYEVLNETVQGLPEDVRRRAVANLLVGLAMDEYRDAHARGDFLIRNLVGVDRSNGALAVSAYPREGQTVQFQMRDGQAADEELVEMLRAESEALGVRRPTAALLCACNGRGAGLFGVPDHDARRVEEALGPLPLTGFFCNGEIGPVGGKTFLHGFTASLALFVPADNAPG